MVKIKMTKLIRKSEQTNWFKLYQNENDMLKPVGKINIYSNFIENSTHLPSNDINEP